MSKISAPKERRLILEFIRTNKDQPENLAAYIETIKAHVKKTTSRKVSLEFYVKVRLAYPRTRIENVNEPLEPATLFDTFIRDQNIPNDERLRNIIYWVCFSEEINALGSTDRELESFRNGLPTLLVLLNDQVKTNSQAVEFALRKLMEKPLEACELMNNALNADPSLVALKPLMADATAMVNNLYCRMLENPQLKDAETSLTAKELRDNFFNNFRSTGKQNRKRFAYALANKEGGALVINQARLEGLLAILFLDPRCESLMTQCLNDTTPDINSRDILLADLERHADEPLNRLKDNGLPLTFNSLLFNSDKISAIFIYRMNAAQGQWPRIKRQQEQILIALSMNAFLNAIKRPFFKSLFNAYHISQEITPDLILCKLALAVDTGDKIALINTIFQTPAIWKNFDKKNWITLFLEIGNLKDDPSVTNFAQIEADSRTIHGQWLKNTCKKPFQRNLLLMQHKRELDLEIDRRAKARVFLENPETILELEKTMDLPEEDNLNDFLEGVVPDDGTSPTDFPITNDLADGTALEPSEEVGISSPQTPRSPTADSVCGTPYTSPNSVNCYPTPRTSPRFLSTSSARTQQQSDSRFLLSLAPHSPRSTMPSPRSRGHFPTTVEPRLSPRRLAFTNSLFDTKEKSRQSRQSDAIDESLELLLDYISSIGSENGIVPTLDNKTCKQIRQLEKKVKELQLALKGKLFSQPQSPDSILTPPQSSSSCASLPAVTPPAVTPPAVTPQKSTGPQDNTNELYDLQVTPVLRSTHDQFSPESEGAVTPPPQVNPFDNRQISLTPFYGGINFQKVDAAYANLKKQWAKLHITLPSAYPKTAGLSLEFSTCLGRIKELIENYRATLDAPHETTVLNTPVQRRR